MAKLTRRDVLGKCIVVFEAIRRAASQGNAGLIAAEGMEESFRVDNEILDTLRTMVQEIEAGENRAKRTEEYQDILKDWQKDLIKNGPPKLMVLGQEENHAEEG